MFGRHHEIPHSGEPAFSTKPCNGLNAGNEQKEPVMLVPTPPSSLSSISFCCLGASNEVRSLHTCNVYYKIEVEGISRVAPADSSVRGAQSSSWSCTVLLIQTQVKFHVDTAEEVLRSALVYRDRTLQLFGSRTTPMMLSGAYRSSGSEMGSTNSS